jgi:hypothetical protein
MANYVDCDLIAVGPRQGLEHLLKKLALGPYRTQDEASPSAGDGSPQRLEITGDVLRYQRSFKWGPPTAWVAVLAEGSWDLSIAWIWSDIGGYDVAERIVWEGGVPRTQDFLDQLLGSGDPQRFESSPQGKRFMKWYEEAEAMRPPPL